MKQTFQLSMSRGYNKVESNTGEKKKVCKNKMTSDVQIKLRAFVEMLLGYLKQMNTPPTLKTADVDYKMMKEELSKLGTILMDNATRVTLFIVSIF